jgi:hypothetical protein
LQFDLCNKAGLHGNQYPGRRATSADLILWGLRLWFRQHETFSCIAVAGLAGLSAISAGFFILLRKPVQRVQRSQTVPEQGA